MQARKWGGGCRFRGAVVDRVLGAEGQGREGKETIQCSHPRSPCPLSLSLYMSIVSPVGGSHPLIARTRPMLHDHARFLPAARLDSTLPPSFHVELDGQLARIFRALSLMHLVVLRSVWHDLDDDVCNSGGGGGGGGVGGAVGGGANAKDEEGANGGSGGRGSGARRGRQAQELNFILQNIAPALRQYKVC